MSFKNIAAKLAIFTLVIAGAGNLGIGQANAVDLGMQDVSAYGADEWSGQTASGPTTGWYLAQGGLYVAANPNTAYLGEHLCAADGTYLGKVVDVKGDPGVDLLYPTTAQAYQWGVRRMRVHTC